MQRKLEKPKISYLLEKTLVLLFIIICSKCKNEDEKLFKEKESRKFLVLLNIYNYFKNMVEENICPFSRKTKNIDEISNYFIEEINRNELMCKNAKNFAQL